MLKKNLLLALVTVVFWVNLKAQYCVPGNRFTEVPVFAATDIVSTMSVSYGHATNYTHQNQNLILNIHYPSSIVDTYSKRPLIVLMHGGGFTGGSLNGLNNDCIEFARRGFVAVTIEYRVGWNIGTTTSCGGDPNSQRLAVYRGIQDLHAAYRYLVNNAATYKIDTAWIFAGGNSAGSFAQVNLAFIDQQEMNAIYPTLQQTLGNIDTSGNHLTNTFRLKGMFHNWGSIFNVRDINLPEAIPMIGFGGDLDIISPIDSGYWANCTNFTNSWGTRSIHNRLISLGKCSQLNVKVGGGHGVYNDNPAESLFRIQRGACFFKSLFCNNCSSSVKNDAGNDSLPADCSLFPVPTSLSKNSKNSDGIQLYPNPFSNKIQLANNYGEITECKLINSLGSIIWNGNNIEQQDFSNLSSGIYFVEITSKDFKKTLKLVKQSGN